jgi:hypothetical protein
MYDATGGKQTQTRAEKKTCSQETGHMKLGAIKSHPAASVTTGNTLDKRDNPPTGSDNPK